VALYGDAIRVEALHGGRYGVALEFFRHRFLYARGSGIPALHA
jgi:hypothetical protein